VLGSRHKTNAPKPIGANLRGASLRRRRRCETATGTLTQHRNNNVMSTPAAGLAAMRHDLLWTD